MLFADDIALVADSRDNLQKQLDIIKNYLEKKELELNAKKSVVLVFRSKGDVDSEVHFNFGGKVLEVNDEFVYLGVKFSALRGMSRHVEDCNLRGNRLINMLLRSNLNQLADMRIQKRVFQTKVASSLHWGSEVWGFAKVAKLEVVQLRYFKRILGLKDSFSSVVLKGDLGLFSLRSVRLVRMVKFWEKIIRLPRVRLLKAAYLESLKDGRRDSWSNQVKKILYLCGLSEMWNEGKGPMDETVSVWKEVQRTLNDQEIQEWQAHKDQSMSLRFYSQAKDGWGEEVYLKFGLNKEDLKNLLLVRGDSLDLGERRKFLGKFRLAAGPYFCPMCGLVNENLFHFVSECEELSELRNECFGRVFGSECWLIERMAERNACAIKQLCKFLRLGTKYRESCLRG